MSVGRVYRYAVEFPFLRTKIIAREFSTDVVVKNKLDECNEVVRYPEIKDLSVQADNLRKHVAESEYLRNIQTVEEKIFRSNMPRYYGWKCFMLNGDVAPLACLPFIQHVTRTHLIKSPSLPEYYLRNETAASYMVTQIKSEIEEAIKFEYQAVRRKIDFSKDLRTPIENQDEEAKSKLIMEQINRIISNHLSPSLPHLMDAQLDVQPRHESFWFAGRFPYRAYNTEAVRKGEKMAMSTVPIQYIGKPVLCLRSAVPLEPLVPYSEALNTSLDVPVYKFFPKNLSFFEEYRHGTNIPGFWTGDTHEFGLLSYYTRSSLLNKPHTYPPDFVDKSLDAMGVLNSFGWLLAQAAYQGFLTYNDLTYPLVTQSIITNGQYWSLFCYQMNTLATQLHNYLDNPKRNICYSVGPLKLFDSIQEDGTMVGFNDDVLKMLLQLYMNTPSAREGVDMKPFLGKHTRHISDIEDDKKRNWLEKHYKHLVANRQRHRLKEEIYHWESIYKIMFKSRFGDNTRKYFEYPNLKSPNRRRLDEHTPKYVPKALREEGYRKVVKWEKTYYP